MKLLRIALFIFVAPSAWNAVGATVSVIEYQNASSGRYFMTSLQHEIDALDTGKVPGWTRTGGQFEAFSKVRTGTSPVCRFYLPPPDGDAHFYSASASECAKAHSRFPKIIEESPAVMHIHLPNTKTGGCPKVDTPVYRLWDGHSDANHRYVTDSAVRAQMVAQGWIAEGYGPDQVIMCAPPHDVTPDDVEAVALPPPCKGTDSRVAVPDAPHGMYVWVPTAHLSPYLLSDVLNPAPPAVRDPTICGASLVIPWSSVETANGVYDWSYVTTLAAPFVSAGLTVNLLFSEATEGASNTVTPAWVTAPVSAGGAGAPTVSCTGQPTMPVYFDATYEATWKAFIAAAVNQFSFSNSALAPSIGYMRFATGGGAEALPPPGYNTPGECEKAWKMAGYTYDVWNTHEANIINAMGSQPTDKQIMVSLPNVSGGATVYTVANLGAAVAVAKGVGLSFESLGLSNVADPGTTPGPCDPTAMIVNLHWCQAYQNYVGDVPLAMQPITATTNTADATMDISNLLQYALDNKIQIFELYVDEWLQADSPTSPGFDPTKQAKYKAALQAASQVLGASNGQ
jgi:hypothetical protein